MRGLRALGFAAAVAHALGCASESVVVVATESDDETATVAQVEPPTFARCEVADPKLGLISFHPRYMAICRGRVVAWQPGTQPEVQELRRLPPATRTLAIAGSLHRCGMYLSDTAGGTQTNYWCLGRDFYSPNENYVWDGVYTFETPLLTDDEYLWEVALFQSERQEFSPPLTSALGAQLASASERCAISVEGSIFCLWDDAGGELQEMRPPMELFDPGL